MKRISFSRRSPAVCLDDAEAHQDHIRTAVSRLQRIGKRIGEQLVVRVDKGDKGSVFTDKLQGGIARFGGAVVLRTDIAKPFVPIGQPAQNGSRAVG